MTSLIALIDGAIFLTLIAATAGFLAHVAMRTLRSAA